MLSDLPLDSVDASSITLIPKKIKMVIFFAAILEHYLRRSSDCNLDSLYLASSGALCSCADLRALENV